MAIILDGTGGITAPVINLTSFTANTISSPVGMNLRTNGTTTAISIDTTQKVGIGTTTMAVQGLTISGSGNYNQSLRLQDTSVANRFFDISYNATGPYMWANNSEPISVFTGGSERLRIDGNGAITAPGNPAFIAETSTNQEPTSNQKIVYDTTTLNVGSYYNTSNSSFTAPVSGLYQFNVRAWARQGTTGTTYIYLYKNGGVLYETRVNFPTALTEFFTVSRIFNVYLSTNDSVSIYGYGPGFHSSTGGRYSEFSGRLMQ